MNKNTLLPAELKRSALTTSETAHTLGVSRPTVYRLVKRGLLKPNRALRHLLFPVDQIDRFVNGSNGKEAGN